MDYSDYVSLKDASKLLNVSPATLRNWDKSKKLIAKRHPINKYRLYKLSEIRSLMNSDQQKEITGASESLLKTDRPNDFRNMVRSMSKAFRDSHGGSLIDRFEEISKLLFIKMYDEKFNQNRCFSFTDSLKDKEIYENIQELFKISISRLPSIFVNGRGKLSKDKKAVVNVARILKKYDLNSISEDIKGNIYEEIIKNTFEKDENQQFFTPRMIVDFMIHMVKPKSYQKFCDPACGSGGFLIRALEYISQNDASDAIKNKERYSRQNVCGIEVDSRMVWVSQMNLIMHGGIDSSIHHIKEGGSFSTSNIAKKILPDSSFDIILTNPPFGSDYSNKKDLDNFQVGKGKKSRRRGVLFLEKCISLLKKGGRLGIILDESILNSNSNKDVREIVFKKCIVEAIVSLPDTTFMPYSSVKSSILFLRKKSDKNEQQVPVFMANVENIGKRPNGEPIFTTERDESGKLKLKSDLPKIISAWNDFSRSPADFNSNKDQNIFVVPDIINSDSRLDTTYFHPAKEKARLLLSKSKYPIVTLAEIVSIINKMVVPKIEYPDELINFIGLANIMPYHGSYYISQVIGEKIKSSVRSFEPDTILFSKLRPELRKVVYIPQDEESGFVSSECFVFKIKSKDISPEYLSIILRSDIVYGQLVYQITGLGRPRINKSAILNLKIPIPSITEQKEIVRVFNSAMETNQNLISESEKLQNQADGLLNRTYTNIQSNLSG